MAILLCDLRVDVVLRSPLVDDVQVRFQVGARDFAITVKVVDAEGLFENTERQRSTFKRSFVEYLGSYQR